MQELTPIVYLFLMMCCHVCTSIKHSDKHHEYTKGPLPIVYVYTVVPAVCQYGLPAYIVESLKQAVFSQEGDDSTIVLASNFGECAKIEETLAQIPKLVKVDTTAIRSKRTAEFANMSQTIFESDYAGELWMTSALRFFIMEDIMNEKGYTEMLHVEADNMLYGKITDILPALRSAYKGVAATPLTGSTNFLTASVFWISNIKYLVPFNDFLLDMGLNQKNTWKSYLYWLRFRGGCCKKGGLDPDANGNGVKPFAVNEMTMMGYYHDIEAKNLKLFPVVPLNKAYPKPGNAICDLQSFTAHGSRVSGPTGVGIWDANSWGQYIGGTSRKKGRDKGFVDSSHISGQSIKHARCVVRMECGPANHTYIRTPYVEQLVVAPVDENSIHNNNSSSSSSIVDRSSSSSSSSNRNSPFPSSPLHSFATGCYTKPFVRCGDSNSTGTPLWNLHVHSKHTANYRSSWCECPE